MTVFVCEPTTALRLSWAIIRLLYELNLRNKSVFICVNLWIIAKSCVVQSLRLLYLHDDRDLVDASGLAGEDNVVFEGDRNVAIAAEVDLGDRF